MTLRARLLIGLAVVPILLAALATLVVVRQRAIMTEQLDARLLAISPLERPPDGSAPIDGPRPPGIAAPVSDVYVARIEADGSVGVAVRGQLLDDDMDPTSFIEQPVAERTFRTVDSTGGTIRFRVLAEPTPDGGTALFAVPITDLDRTIDELIVMFLLVGAAIAVVLGAVGWWVSGLGLRPITAMTATAESIARGDRSRRIPEHNPDTEAGQLARALNAMLDQRDAAEDRLRRFVSDASHELRTPLTSVRGYLELFQNDEFVGSDRMPDAIRRMTAESDRMAVLVEDLLHLARLDEEQPLVVETTDVGELVRDVCADAVTARPRLELDVRAPSRGELIVPIDRGRVSQVVAGLIDNAAVHAPGAAVDVGAGRRDGELWITVADHGPGLSAEQAERVFDRFYRGDESRSRRNGGSGLGLAIARSVADRHGGEIDLDTGPDRGCRFTLRLPTAGPGAESSQP